MAQQILLTLNADYHKVTDSISCILWTIFYDTLLTKLRSKKIGYKFNSDLQIIELAFADDLTPFAESPEDLTRYC
jgi:hypothetical protein